MLAFFVFGIGLKGKKSSKIFSKSIKTYIDFKDFNLGFVRISREAILKNDDKQYTP